MDEILGLPARTLRGEEKLEDLENWDSTSLITLIALADTNNGVRISLGEIVNCSTVADLLRLAGAEK
jgi:acyl carrier protein